MCWRGSLRRKSSAFDDFFGLMLLATWNLAVDTEQKIANGSSLYECGSKTAYQRIVLARLAVDDFERADSAPQRTTQSANSLK